MLALFCGMTLTSCMDDDWEDPNGSTIPTATTPLRRPI